MGPDDSADGDENAVAATGGECVNAGMGTVPLRGTPYSVKKNRFLSPLGIPCQKPPFGMLSAMDLSTQQLIWQGTVGTVEDTDPFGIKVCPPIPIGMPTVGGTLATQSGLVFIAGVQDYYRRAYNSETGGEVWKQRVPSAARVARSATARRQEAGSML